MMLDQENQDYHHQGRFSTAHDALISHNAIDLAHETYQSYATSTEISAPENELDREQSTETTAGTTMTSTQPANGLNPYAAVGSLQVNGDYGSSAAYIAYQHQLGAVTSSTSQAHTLNQAHTHQVNRTSLQQQSFSPGDGTADHVQHIRQAGTEQEGGLTEAASSEHSQATNTEHDQHQRQSFAATNGQFHYNPYQHHNHHHHHHHHQQFSEEVANPSQAAVARVMAAAATNWYSSKAANLFYTGNNIASGYQAPDTDEAQRQTNQLNTNCYQQSHSHNHHAHTHTHSQSQQPLQQQQQQQPSQAFQQQQQHNHQHDHVNQYQQSFGHHNGQHPYQQSFASWPYNSYHPSYHGHSNTQTSNPLEDSAETQVQVDNQQEPRNEPEQIQAEAASSTLEGYGAMAVSRPQAAPTVQSNSSAWSSTSSSQSSSGSSSSSSSSSSSNLVASSSSPASSNPVGQLGTAAKQPARSASSTTATAATTRTVRVGRVGRATRRSIQSTGRRATAASGNQVSRSQMPTIMLGGGSNSNELSAYDRDADYEDDSKYVIVTDPRDGREVKLTNEMLIGYSARQLNKTVAGFPPSTIKELKQRRRRLKNRGYAQNCRHKRLDHKIKLEHQNADLRAKFQEQSRLIVELKKQLETFKSSACACQQERNRTAGETMMQY